jgi:hypothetical protein
MAYTKFKPLVSKYYFISQLDIKEIPIYAFDYLDKDEEALFIFVTHKDVSIFTNKKILLFNKSGLINKWKEVLSIPYKSIVTSFVYYGNLTSEIRLTLYNSYPIKLKFLKWSDRKKTEIKKVYQLILSKISN